ncbi:hypothetical protein M0Q28_00300 [Patescibacteria group bacterium]|jgi:hypothetical protein|nr:hypothetical protein [Patescibacteria group bacterium]
MIMSNRFGFYGVLGGITFAFLVSKLMGCASPASADHPRDERPSITTVEIIGQTETFVTDDGITVEVEPGTLTLYHN